MEVSEGRANVEIDPRVFRLPPPAGMEKLRLLVGRFEVAARRAAGLVRRWAETSTTATLRADFDHALIEEEMSVVLGRVHLTESGFKVDVEVSADGGETWVLDHQFTYTRAEDTAAASSGHATVTL